jgi:hypothetical protein
MEQMDRENRLNCKPNWSDQLQSSAAGCQQGIFERCDPATDSFDAAPLFPELTI